MADVKQILVVDDHFEMLEFLRSMLELSSQDYRVWGVPSAEEGFLELRRTAFDLLITDLRLPGMSGFDLVRKVKGTSPGLPIIMITGYSSEQGKQEAAELGVFRYFQKPLDTEALLTTVQAALYKQTGMAADGADAGATDSLVLDPEVVKRLDVLRADTGARMIVLGNGRGGIRYQTGEAGGLDVSQLALTIANTINDSFLLADQLGSSEPFAIQYQAGQRFDLYSANVGRGHFLAIFFDAASRRGRIGTIWVFAQRAIKDLLPLLPSAPALRTVIPTTLVQPPVPPAPLPATSAPAQEELEREEPEAQTAALEVAPEVITGIAPEATPDADPAPLDEPLPQFDDVADLPPLPELETALETADRSLDLDAFWDTAAVEADLPRVPDGLVSLEEVQAQGLVDLEFEQPQETDGVDLDLFWDEALTEEPAADIGSGFSLDEAKRQGLLPSELDLDRK
jgi:CheY-like chemotaxis protein